MSENVAESNARRTRKIAAYTKSGNFVKRFLSIKKAAAFCRVAPNNIGGVCKGARKSLGGYIFYYAD